MKIIGIVGMLDFNRKDDAVWKGIGDAFIEEFPNASFIVHHTTYLPWQGDKMRSLADSIISTHDNSEELLLIGYSLGSIIALSIAERFTKSRVRAVVTINTPNAIKMFFTILHARRQPLKIPVCSVGSIFDPVVPWFLAHYPGSVRMNLISDHVTCFLRSRTPAKKVARKVKAILSVYETSTY